MKISGVIWSRDLDKVKHPCQGAIKSQSPVRLPSGGNCECQNEERHLSVVIPVGLDAKHGEQNGSNRVKEGDQEECFEWSGQATPVDPTGENTNDPASQHASEQVSRGGDSN